MMVNNISFIKAIAGENVSLEWFSKVSGVARSRIASKFLSDAEMGKVTDLCERIAAGEVKPKKGRIFTKNNYYDQLKTIVKGDPRQSWLHEKIGAPLSTISGWRNGTLPSKPYNRRLMKLCTDLLSGEEEFDDGRCYQQYNKERNEKARVCLKCEAEFMSYGPQNRICTHCRSSNSKELDAYYDLAISC